jgi:transposase
LKYPLTPEPKKKQDWKWTQDVWLPIPPVLVERFKQNAQALAPNLRLMDSRQGQSLAVLDFITANEVQPVVGTGNFLAFDWGVRRLATIVILDQHGQQLTPPLFLNTAGFNRHQANLRTQIDYLKAKRDKLPAGHPDRTFYQTEIDHCWRKYGARNDLLAHFTSNLVLCLAMIYDCDVIAGEWLKTLKARKNKRQNKKADRWRRWSINTTIRETIATKIRYKAGLVGKHFVTVWPRGTSHECPHCGERGITCKSPEDRVSIRWGAWFVCKACGYNADRDYIAAVNIGRRAVWKEQEVIRPASYIGACGAALLFPSQAADRFVRKLVTTLKGLSQVTHIRPDYILLC